MYSFFLLEGTHVNGAIEYRNTAIFNNLPQIKAALDDYTGPGGGFIIDPDQTLVLRVYQHGECAAEHDLFPQLRIRIPGFTELGFDCDHEHVGGEPEPGSENDGIDDLEVLADIHSDEFLDQADARAVTVDWHGLKLPALRPPLLPEGTKVELDDEEFAYGVSDIAS